MRIAPLLIALPLTALAQTGASVTLLSDFRVRGISLSDERPSAQLDFAYDAPSGGYAGAAISSVRLGENRQDQGQVQGYLGYARALDAGLGWEVGATTIRYTNDSYYSYQEYFAGLNGEQWNARLYYAPAYYGFPIHAGYAELNRNLPLSEHTRLVLHAGVLTRVGHSEYAGTGPVRLDGRLGVSTTLDQWELQLAWVGTNHIAGPYAPVYVRNRSAAVITASCFF
ncbi:MAG: hypothetical protein JO142_09630 [Burkholderiales bacterium]|nr:hypothetical protein [Burkholderiales bacterium]